MPRIFLSGASLVLSDRVASGQTLVVDDGRIVDIVAGPRLAGSADVHVDLTDRIVVPGFIDVHVHGIEGIDVLDGVGAVSRVAERLPRWGVTAFAPTSIACPPDALRTMLAEVGRLRGLTTTGARVLPAHLESNFISPDYRGAQPAACLRVPSRIGRRAEERHDRTFETADVLSVIESHRADVGVVTMAPELDGALDLIQALVSSGIRVSLGHSGATFEQAQRAIAAGARRATHLFNRMSPMTSRDPGLVGAVLAHEEVVAELICDGVHVHPAVMRVAIAAKDPACVMAITDGTAGSGLAPGSRARLGGQSISVGDVARLEDGTMAGSVLTMDRAFSCLVTRCDIDLVHAAAMCATTPARELGLVGLGILTPGAMADLTVLDTRLEVVETWVEGRRVWPAAMTLP
jgi:N-acetylglucosamine-6-phosphate deacetylase